MKSPADYLAAAQAAGPDEYGTLGGRIVGMAIAEQAIALALADATAELARNETYHRLLQRAVRHAQASTPNQA